MSRKPVTRHHQTNEETRLTADQALALSAEQWRKAMTTLNAREQIALASDILRRCRGTDALNRARRLCKAAATNKESHHEEP